MSDSEQTIYDRFIELLIIFLLIFTPFAFGAIQTWSVIVFEGTAVLMALLWIFKRLKTGTFEFVPNPTHSFIFFFLFYVLLQRSIYPWATKMELFKVISYALIFFIVLNTSKTKQQIIRILSIVVLMGFVMGIFSLMRYFGVEVPFRIVNPDHLSAYLSMTIPLALGFLFVGSQSSAISHQTDYSLIAKRFLLFFCAIVMTVALFLTMSRGGMFSFMGALLLMAILVLRRKSIEKKGWILSTVAILVVLTLAWLGATPVIERILSIKVEIGSLYFGGRLPIWEGTFNIIRDYPLFGTGFGTFNYIFSKYQPMEIIAKHYTYAHSDVLELLSEIGIVGFLFFTLYILIFSVYVFKKFGKRKNPWVVGMSIGFFGSLASIFIHSFTDFNLHIPANAILLTIVLALFLAILNLSSKGMSLKSHIFIVPRLAKFAFYPVIIFLAGIFWKQAINPVFAERYYKLNAIEDAINLDPTNATYHYDLGKLYSKQAAESLVNRIQKLNNAIFAYKKAVELNPTNSKYRQSLAWAYGQVAGYSQDARREFETAIILEPNNSYRHRIYAMWLFRHPKKENIEKGVIEYKKAIALKPQFASEALAQYFTVEKSYRELKRILSDTPEDHYKVMNMLLEAGLWEQNEADFREDMKKASYKYPYYKAISRYYAINKKIKKSIGILEHYLKIDPRCADAHFLIADRSFYDENYGWEFTETHHREAGKLDPNNLRYKYWYAVHLTHKGRRMEANNLFDEIVAADPRYSERINKFKSKL